MEHIDITAGFLQQFEIFEIYPLRDEKFTSLEPLTALLTSLVVLCHCYDFKIQSPLCGVTSATKEGG